MTTLLSRLPAIQPAICALLLVLTIGIASLPQQAWAAMQPTTQPVMIMVRDGAGIPMMGIPIKILIDEPPDLLDHDQCVTGQDGTCTVHLLPGTYRVQFVQGWYGRLFIPVEDQEVFKMTVVQSDQVQYQPFTIAEHDGQLVPVWDMSRDPSQPPKPFLPSFTNEDPLASLNLGPLTTGLPGSTQPPVPGGTATSQVAVDVVGSGAGASPTAEALTPTPAARPSARDSLRTVLIILIALVFVALLLVVIVRSGAFKRR